MEQKESNHQVPKSRAPKHFSLKTKPEHPKYDRIFMPSRRPKVMILIWKDRYLSHDPRRSGKRSFGSLVGPELIFYQDMSDERLRVVVDVLLEIGDTKIPVDFHVMNIKEGSDTPLILGRPFLATAGAIMDLPNGRISLANVDKTVFYPTIPFISPTKLSYFITARDRPKEPPDHAQGHDETNTKRL
ncbi:unnamed protein product [Microthlaspi erraticum]|uniref:Uncharacterized protein n=1 Tax=Microthlaspi erraticum TaxID=1685480 RepID=A0A6D2HZ29_9BRAS|nr:unnamed protein product [Microthlaspi erraticum]